MNVSHNLEPDFNFFIPADIIKAKDKKGNEVMRVKGIASTPDLDSEGEVLLPIGFDLNRFITTGHINWNHQGKLSPDKIIGEPDVAKVTPKGELYIEGILYPESDLAKSVWKLGETLEKNSKNRRLGWSIEGKSLERDPMNPKRITKALITGVAITPTPVNVNTFVDLVKGQQKEDYINLEFNEDDLLTKSEDEKYLYEFKAGDTQYAINKSFELVEIEKNIKANIGEIRVWDNKKYKKQFDGKWKQIIEGKTKEDYQRLLISLNKDIQRLRKEQKNSISASRQLDSSIDRVKEIREILKKIEGASIEIDETEKAIIPDIEKESDKKQAKIKKVMSEFKAGTLKSSSGELVTDRDQALAIALSEAKQLDKAMDTESTKPLHPESLDKKVKVMEPIIKKAILEGIIPTNKLTKIIK